MAKTASLNIRLDSEIKKTAESVYSHYGLSLAEAVTVFIHQSCNIGGLPFDLRPMHPTTDSMEAIFETGQVNRAASQSILNRKEVRREAVSQSEASDKLPCSTALGIWKNKVWMADDFNEPLEERI